MSRPGSAVVLLLQIIIIKSHNIGTYTAKIIYRLQRADELMPSSSNPIGDFGDCLRIDVLTTANTASMQHIFFFLSIGSTHTARDTLRPTKEFESTDTWQLMRLNRDSGVYYIIILFLLLLCRQTIITLWRRLVPRRLVLDYVRRKSEIVRYDSSVNTSRRI